MPVGYGITFAVLHFLRDVFGLLKWETRWNVLKTLNIESVYISLMSDMNSTTLLGMPK